VQKKEKGRRSIHEQGEKEGLGVGMVARASWREQKTEVEWWMISSVLASFSSCGVH
jgi:hypothetical protein